MNNLVLFSMAALWVIVIINFVITLALVRQTTNILRLAKINSSGTTSSMLKLGDKAPEFNLLSLDGAEVSSKNYIGKPTVLVFVSPTCGPCKDRMAEFVSLYPHTLKADINFVVISLASLESTKDFATEFDDLLPILSLPQDTTFVNDYNIAGTPTYYLINKDWRVESGGPLNDSWKNLTRQWQPTQQLNDRAVSLN